MSDLTRTARHLDTARRELIAANKSATSPEAIALLEAVGAKPATSSPRAPAPQIVGSVVDDELTEVARAVGVLRAPVSAVSAA